MQLALHCHSTTQRYHKKLSEQYSPYTSRITKWRHPLSIKMVLGKWLCKCHKICIKKTEILRSKQLHVELTCIFQSDTPPFTQPLHQFVYKSQRQKWLQAAENKMCHRLNIKLYLRQIYLTLFFNALYNVRWK